MEFLKMDKNMLLSIINMKLRDEFKNIKELCSYYDVSLKDMQMRLDELSLIYDREVNQLKNK